MTAAAEQSNAPQFAQVAVPVHLRKLFTYKLPSSMQAATRVGSRVMVQFGAKPTVGYVVALLPKLRTGTSLVESELKEIQELLDVDPPLTPEVLEITRWVSDYYAAPWGEVMRAALPAGINASVERTISITKLGRESISLPGDSSSLAATANESVPTASAGGSNTERALVLLAKEGEFELNAFCLRMGSKRPPRWLRTLEHEGLIELAYRTRATPTRAKRRKALRLINSAADGARITKAQQRAIEILAANGNEMPVADLIANAHISESVVHTLVKNGLAEEFETELRRDPLSRAELPETENFRLTEAQTEALQTIEQSLNAVEFAPTLLHGITGSGKTEIYIRAMQAALEMNRGAMMLVPEIALTPILSRRLRAHFGGLIADR